MDPHWQGADSLRDGGHRIGVGVVLGGQLYRGADGSHPEMGHQVIDSTGRQCDCGARGCWEVLARGPAMTEWMDAQATADTEFPHASPKRICELAAAGHSLANQAVKRKTHYRGLGLASLVIIFCSEVIVLGGSVMGSAKLFLDGIRQEIRQNCGLVPYGRTEIRLASLGPHAALIGAARTWHHRLIEKGESSVIGS